jgi:predicted nucleic acid-binding protein
MPGDRVFVDSNIIVYAYDVSAGDKNKIAKDILVELWNNLRGVISTQVVQELFVALTKKIPKPLDAESAKIIVSDLLKWDVIINDGESILEAIAIHLKHKYSFWDSMIIEAALQSGADLLLSENLANGQIIDGLTIKNPFLSGAVSD